MVVFQSRELNFILAEIKWSQDLEWNIYYLNKGTILFESFEFFFNFSLKETGLGEHRCPCKDIFTFLLRHQLGLY